MPPNGSKGPVGKPVGFSQGPFPEVKKSSAEITNSVYRGVRSRRAHKAAKAAAKAADYAARKAAAKVERLKAIAEGRTPKKSDLFGTAYRGIRDIDKRIPKKGGVLGTAVGMAMNDKRMLDRISKPKTSKATGKSPARGGYRGSTRTRPSPARGGPNKKK